MLQPIQDKIVLEIKKEEEITKGGIILSSNLKTKTQIATVVAVGPGVTEKGIKIEMEVKEHDIVFLEHDIGTEIEYEGKKFLVVNQKDILAIVK